ncbi:spore-associated protein A [Streptomyces sp. BE147]|uniref:spore-associated protein A n=1 Tax=Streptomyces sp. BE147 TaxID=3002524 RepID=UPI002E7A3326|nr:spore-associated protein A [Streptomyces sp. BE147]MEE1736836.1 spore-associated protein A [Streptomyces sp. BE147]
MLSRRTLAGLSAPLLTLAMLVGFPGTANASAAASPNVAYNGKCGSGYNVVNWKDTQFGRGTVYVTWSPAAQKNCVVAIRATQDGSIYELGAWVGYSGQAWYDHDFGMYQYYAGPVYLPGASGRCIDWRGEIGATYASGEGTNCG